MPLTQVFFALLLCSLLSGCSALMKQARGVSHLQGEVYVAPSVEPDANGDSPVAVDVVAVHGAALLKEVSKLTAQAWFQQKSGLVQLHPGDLKTASWEWVPGQSLDKVKVPGTGVADGVLLFANYTSPGPHSAKLPRSGTVAVDFGPNDFSVISKP
jgi:type VI secretion system protein